jgi:hypothetical protein
MVRLIRDTDSDEEETRTMVPSEASPLLRPSTSDDDDDDQQLLRSHVDGKVPLPWLKVITISSVLFVNRYSILHICLNGLSTSYTLQSPSYTPHYHHPTSQTPSSPSNIASDHNTVCRGA